MSRLTVQTQAGGMELTEAELVAAVQAEPHRHDRQIALAARLIVENRPAALGEIWRALPVRFPHDPCWRLLSALAWFWTGADRQRALIEAQAARTIDPDFWPGHLAEAHLLCEIGEFAMIEQGFRDYWSYGRRRFAPAARHALTPALEAARRAAALAPRAEVWNDIGAIEFAAGRFDAAEIAFVQALRIDPAQRHALINLAVALLMQGQDERLEDYLRKTTFPAPLPPCLEEAAAGKERSAFWRQPVNDAEWRRIAVFSQRWWRVLPALMSKTAAAPKIMGVESCA